MPPRYAYWTILVDEQPTAFRASSQEDLMPTFKRLKEKNPTAKMMWWQNGKLWPSRVDAQEAMHARGEMGRQGDAKQFGRRSEGGGGFRDRKRTGDQERAPREQRDPSGKLEWKPKAEDGAGSHSRPNKFATEGREPRRSAQREGGTSGPRPEWRPKDTRRSSPTHVARTFTAHRDKPEWTPKGAGSDREFKKQWRPKPNSFSRPQDVKTSRPPRGKSQGALEWRPKGAGFSGPQALKPSGPKRKWVPKEEYKKSQGIEARRDKNWRPGGEHKDPRQKYKDAKKAKWTRFKQTVRKRWEAKQPGAPKKKRREEE